MAVFTSAQDFLFSNSQSKKFELIKKPYVPRALRFWCQGPSRLREAERAVGTRMTRCSPRNTLFVGISKIAVWIDNPQKNIVLMICFLYSIFVLIIIAIELRGRVIKKKQSVDTPIIHIYFCNYIFRLWFVTLLLSSFPFYAALFQ